MRTKMLSVILAALFVFSLSIALFLQRNHAIHCQLQSGSVPMARISPFGDWTHTIHIKKPRIIWIHAYRQCASNKLELFTFLSQVYKGNLLYMLDKSTETLGWTWRTSGATVRAWIWWLPYSELFRGYLDFDGNVPSDATFVHGVAYQWVYLMAPEDAILTAPNTAYAQWDTKVGAWLVGFSIYMWDKGPQDYKTAERTRGQYNSSRRLSNTNHVFNNFEEWRELCVKC